MVSVLAKNGLELNVRGVKRKQGIMAGRKKRFYNLKKLSKIPPMDTWYLRKKKARHQKWAGPSAEGGGAMVLLGFRKIATAAAS
jgi:hypothetical protein